MDSIDSKDIAEMLIPTMSRCVKYIELYMEKRLSESGVGLTLKQFILLHHTRLGGRSQSDLAIITYRDKGSLTRLIQGMERKNLVVREVDPKDMRINIVTPTEEGRRAMKEAREIVRLSFEELTKGISEEDEAIMKHTASRMMQRAIETLD